MPDEHIVTIRKYSDIDKREIRNISCETAFLSAPRENIFDDDEILADFLTLYFTDFEPESSYVAIEGSKVIGYITGATNVKVMRKTIIKIMPRLIIHAIFRGVFLRKITRSFAIHATLSFLKGEFFAPDFAEMFPATLHINIDKDYRRLKIGTRLMETYIDYLKEKNIKGVHLGTMSESGKLFFTKLGFRVLFEGRRSYMSYYLKAAVPYYILGRSL